MAGTLSFGYDGDDGLGDRLLAAVLRGEKTATSSLAVEYLSGEPLPRVGETLSLVDHDGRTHGVVETTRVTIVPLHLVGDDVARDEGEGFVNARPGGEITCPSGTTSQTSSARRPATPPGGSASPNPSSSNGFAS